jgi:general secretion pathway protein E
MARHAFQRSSAFARAPDLAASVRRLVSDGKTTVEEAIRIMRKDAGADAAL